MSQAIKVLFRAERAAPHHVTAVFPTLPGTCDPATFAIYAQGEGHGSGAREWYDKTRPAKPREYASTARQLRKGYGYTLKVGKRFTRADDMARAALCR